MLINLVIQRHVIKFQISRQIHDFGWNQPPQPITKVLGMTKHGIAKVRPHILTSLRQNIRRFSDADN